MSNKITKAFAKAAGIRAVKTVAQAAIATLGVGYTGLLDVDWVSVGSVSGLAGVISLLTSLAGLPEVEPKVAIVADDEPGRHAAPEE